MNFEYRPTLSEEDTEILLQQDQEYEQWLEELESEDRADWFARNFYDD